MLPLPGRMREPDQIPGVTRPTQLQLPVSQHFTNARLEQAYRQYIGTIQLGNDVAMTRLMMVRRVGVGKAAQRVQRPCRRRDSILMRDPLRRITPWQPTRR
ncbi:hypothetical protein ACKKBG_A03755 [Auxenochlorella protothecoides x Auxenochlorella symbiontica]